MSGGNPPRRAPPGVSGGDVNWFCDVPHAAAQITLVAADLDAMRFDAEGVSRQLAVTGLSQQEVFVPGTAAASIPHLGPLAAPLSTRVATIGHVVAAAGGGDGSSGAALLEPFRAQGAAVAGGIGFPSGPSSAMDLEALGKAVSEMRDQLRGKTGGGDNRQGKEEDRDRRKKKEKNKRKDRRGSSSSSGRRRRRRRASSSSSSSSTA